MHTLTAHWTFDEKNHLEKDFSGKNHPLSAQNSPKQSERDPTRVTKQFALELDGASSMSVPIADPNLDDFNPRKNHFFVAFFFRAKAKGFLISKGNRFSTDEGWSLFLSEDSKKDWWVNFRINTFENANNGRNKHRAAIAVRLSPDNKHGWHHITGLINRDLMHVQLYLDGQEVVQTASTLYHIYRVGGDFNSPNAYTDIIQFNERIDNNKPVEIGRRMDGKLYFTGWLDEIRVYNDDILPTPKEIARLAQRDFLRFDDFTEYKMYSPTVKPLLSVSPVILPDDDDDVTTSNAPEDNKFFGYPITAKLGQTVIIGFGRKVFALPRGCKAKRPSVSETNTHSSGSLVLQSNDGGRNWQSVVLDLKKQYANEIALPHNQKYLISGMRTIGSSDNAIHFLTTAGVFEHSPSGWLPSPEAYSKVLLPGATRMSVGPKVVKVLDANNHPFLCFFHSRATKKPHLTFGMGYSDDDGKTWHQAVWFKSGPEVADFTPVEPMVIVYENRIIILARNFHRFQSSYNTNQYEMHYMMMIAKNKGLPVLPDNSPPGTFPFDLKDTTLVIQPHRAKSNAKSKFDIQDTIDIMYNPLSTNFEVLLTRRYDFNPTFLNPPINNHALPKMTISLWSISPTDLLGTAPIAKWLPETELLARRHRWGSGPMNYDGFHNAASFIDDNNTPDSKDDMQVTHFYSGYGCWASGIFELRRSLNTVNLKAALATAQTEYASTRMALLSINETEVLTHAQLTTYFSDTQSWEEDEEVEFLKNLPDVVDDIMTCEDDRCEVAPVDTNKDVAISEEDELEDDDATEFSDRESICEEEHCELDDEEENSTVKTSSASSLQNPFMFFSAGKGILWDDAFQGSTFLAAGAEITSLHTATPVVQLSAITQQLLFVQWAVYFIQQWLSWGESATVSNKRALALTNQRSSTASVPQHRMSHFETKTTLFGRQQSSQLHQASTAISLQSAANNTETIVGRKI